MRYAAVDVAVDQSFSNDRVWIEFDIEAQAMQGRKICDSERNDTSFDRRRAGEGLTVACTGARQKCSVGESPAGGAGRALR